MKRCPRCGCTEFFVTAHVAQDWRVDKNGNFVEELNTCIEVTHFPDDDDIWDCAECGYSNSGETFNVKENS